MRIIFALGLILVGCATWAAGQTHSVTEEDVFALQRPAETGDRAAIKKLFGMQADGAVAEDIDIVLGGIIRVYPQMFLEELNNSWLATCEECLPGLLGNTGEKLVDRLQEQAQELRMRRDALRSVSDKSLSNLRDKCIRILDEDIKKTLKANEANTGDSK